MYHYFKMRRRFILQCCAILSAVAVIPSLLPSPWKHHTGGEIRTRVAAGTPEGNVKTRGAGEEVMPLASRLLRSGGRENKEKENRSSSRTDFFYQNRIESANNYSLSQALREKSISVHNDAEDMMQIVQGGGDAVLAGQGRLVQGGDELGTGNRKEQSRQETKHSEHRQHGIDTLRRLQEEAGEITHDEDVPGAENMAPEQDPRKGADSAIQAAPLPPERKPAKLLKRRRVRVIRKTILNGKVVKTSVLGTRTLIVDEKGKPVANQPKAYDAVWYRDILAGLYQANKVHVENGTENESLLTQLLWKFEDPHSEKLFLYNKLLQHQWTPDYTNVHNLRKELLASDIDAHENLIVTRENAPLGLSMALYASPPIRINNTTERWHLYNVTEDLRNHVPDVSPFRGKMYKRCAVIGNSGNLLNSSCGRYIDSFDMIFRCNAAPIAKYARDAGWKSNVTTFNPSIFFKSFNGLKSKEDRFQFHSNITQYNGYLWMTCIGSISMHNICLNAQSEGPQGPGEPDLVVAHTPEFMKFWNFWKQRNFTKQPSTGFYIAHSAIQLCEETHLFGFWPFPLRLDTGFERIRYHYFDDIIVGQNHGMRAEFSIFIQYHELGIIRLHAGTCGDGVHPGM